MRSASDSPNSSAAGRKEAQEIGGRLLPARRLSGARKFSARRTDTFVTFCGKAVFEDHSACDRNGRSLACSGVSAPAEGSATGAQRLDPVGLVLLGKAMKQAIGQVSLLVRDYDEAIEYYTKVLGFLLVEDVVVDADGKRWVVVAPPGAVDCGLLLARPRKTEDAAMIGRQAGNRVFLFLHTDDFGRDYRKYQERGVRFCEEPRKEAYGTVVVFEDLYGNRWDLLERKRPSLK